MGVEVTCPLCKQKLSAPETSRGGPVRCSVCNQVFNVPADAPVLATPSGAPGGPGMGTVPPSGTVPSYGMGPTRGDEVYQLYFNLGSVGEQELACWKSWRTTEFSTAGAILLDIVTCGLFGLIYYGLKFDEIPKVSREDFGAGKAIGFSFIPYFNLYWVFKFWLGLCDRVNFQLRLRGMNHLLLPRDLAMAVCVLRVCSCIPYLGCLAIIAEIVCREILIGKLQQAINVVAQQQLYAPLPQGFVPPQPPPQA